MLIYLFGLSAAGKNYVGRVLEETFGFTFYDGDLDLTEEMRDAVRTQQPFTEEMRDRYYTVIVERITELRQDNRFLAFGQATFKERHRQQILAAHPDTVFVLISADLSIRMERLQRGNNPVTAEYARFIDQFFEPPQHPVCTIHNSGTRSDVADQCLYLLSDLARTGKT
ncbi:MAG: shikimate kinase [Chloroflexota bacterium]